MKFICPHIPLLLVLIPAGLPAATIRGKVIDPAGAPMDAYVFVYDNSSHPKINGPLPGVTTVADGEGRFALEVAPGFYDVCTFKAGFTAWCRKVRLSTRDAVVGVTFKMKLDPSSTGKEFE
jgi:hypothetical protein